MGEENMPGEDEGQGQEGREAEGPVNEVRTG